MGDPIHQFHIVNLFTLGHLGRYEIAFTNSGAFMLGSVLLITLLMLVPTRSRALVPGRLQSVAELTYEFAADTLRMTAGHDGMRFFPFVFTIFNFLLISNVLGWFPFSFTVSSHIIVTVALALLVFFTVVIYGFWHNGVKFLKLFIPPGIPIYILPLVSTIEVLSFLTRPVSHSVRLFANMLAGHITIQVFAGFVVMLGAFGIPGWIGAVLPLGLTTALVALELLVAVLQAYVFAILTCIYLNDAIHPGH